MTLLSETLLNMIKESDGHLTAENVFLLAKKQNVNVSMASVYRVLTKLANEGYIKKISLPGQPDIFDKTIGEHGHLKCLKCGRIKDIHLAEFESLLTKVTGIQNISSYNLCIDYICDDCQRKEGK